MKFRKFSQNISWPVDMNMQMIELMMLSPHCLPYIIYIKFWKFNILPKLVIVCPSYQDIYIGVNIILHLFREELRQV